MEKYVANYPRVLVIRHGRGQPGKLKKKTVLASG